MNWKINNYFILKHMFNHHKKLFVKYIVIWKLALLNFIVQIYFSLFWGFKNCIISIYCICTTTCSMVHTWRGREFYNNYYRNTVHHSMVHSAQCISVESFPPIFITVHCTVYCTVCHSAGAVTSPKLVILSVILTLIYNDQIFTYNLNQV